MFTTSSQTCGIETVAAANATIAMPTIQAFQDAVALPLNPSAQGDMNNQTPKIRFTQSCHRFAVIHTYPH